MGAARKLQETRGDRIIRFCQDYLTVPEGAHGGRPVRLREWQQDLIRAIYDDPTRKVIISFPRKNGKTALTAMLVLAHLVGPEARHNSAIYSVAQSRDQAGIVFGLAAKMVRLSQILLGAVTVRDSAKELFCTRTSVRYKALSAEAPTAYGLSPVMVVHDELGQVRGPRSELYDALETSMGAHDDPISIIISTQAPTDADLLSTLIDAAKLDDSGETKAFVYAADDDDDPWDEATWFKANPALGDFLSLEELRRTARQAQQLPAMEAAFRNLHLNQRVAAEDHYLPPDIWKLNGGEPDQAAFEEYPVCAGLDLSKRTDLTALVLAARDADGVVHLRPHFFAPAKGLRERSVKDKVPYDLWAQRCARCIRSDKACTHPDKLLTITPGATVDYEWVGAKLLEISKQSKIKQIRYDAWRMEELQEELGKIGLELPLEGMRQGHVTMAPALDAFEALALNGKLRHGMHPILTWNASNAIAPANPAGDRKLDKSKSTGRIDGIVAAVMAVAALGSPTEPEPAYNMLFV
jgi:phage terminase large subunit-like protein